MSEQVMKPKVLEQEGSVVLPFLKKLPETSQVTLQNSGLQGKQKVFGELSRTVTEYLHVVFRDKCLINDLESLGAKWLFSSCI